MALYLPIRAVSRSQAVRIGGQKILATTTAYVDISDGPTRRELNHFQAIGSVIPVGQASAFNTPNRAWSGGVVSVGSGTRTVDITAGELRLETGVYVTAALVDELAGTANASGAT